MRDVRKAGRSSFHARVQPLRTAPVRRMCSAQQRPVRRLRTERAGPVRTVGGALHPLHPPARKAGIAKQSRPFAHPRGYQARENKFSTPGSPAPGHGGFAAGPAKGAVRYARRPGGQTRAGSFAPCPHLPPMAEGMPKIASQFPAFPPQKRQVTLACFFSHPLFR